MILYLLWKSTNRFRWHLSTMPVSAELHPWEPRWHPTRPPWPEVTYVVWPHTLRHCRSTNDLADHRAVSSGAPICCRSAASGFRFLRARSGSRQPHPYRTPSLRIRLWHPPSFSTWMILGSLDFQGLVSISPANKHRLDTNKFKSTTRRQHHSLDEATEGMFCKLFWPNSHPPTHWTFRTISTKNRLDVTASLR